MRSQSLCTTSFCHARERMLARQKCPPVSLRIEPQELQKDQASDKLLFALTCSHQNSISSCDRETMAL